MGDWLTDFIDKAKYFPWRMAMNEAGRDLSTLTSKVTKPLEPYKQPVKDFFNYATGMRDPLIDKEEWGLKEGEAPGYSPAAKLGIGAGLGLQLSDLKGPMMAVGVMPPVVRGLARVLTKERLAKEIAKPVFNAAEPAVEGFGRAVTKLGKTHPRLMTELDRLEVTGYPDSLGAYDRGGISSTGWTIPKEDIQSHNKDVQALYERVTNGRPTDMERMVADMRAAMSARGSGSMGLGAEHFKTRLDSVTLPQNIKDAMNRVRAEETAYHEATHHAQDMISNTKSRQAYTLGRSQRVYGPVVGYNLDLDELGARTTAGRKAVPRKANVRNYLEDWINETNRTLKDLQSDPQNLVHIKDWMDDMLPIASERFGRNLIPITGNGKFSVGMGSARPSRIMNGLPMESDQAFRLRDINPNNFRQNGTRFEKEIEKLFKIIGPQVNPEQARANFRGEIPAIQVGDQFFMGQPFHSSIADVAREKGHVIDDNQVIRHMFDPTENTMRNLFTGDITRGGTIINLADPENIQAMAMGLVPMNPSMASAFQVRGLPKQSPKSLRDIADMTTQKVGRQPRIPVDDTWDRIFEEIYSNFRK